MSLGFGPLSGQPLSATPAAASGNATATPSGVSAATALGSPTLAVATLPSGVSLATAIGTVVIVVTAMLTGVQSATALGTPTVTGTAKVTPSGVTVTSAVGTVSVSTSGNVTVTPSGVQSTSAIGTPTGVVAKTPSGVQAASAIGAVTVVVTAIPSGVQAASALGTVSVSASGSTTVTPSGVQGTTALGTSTGLVAKAPTGVQAATAIGTVTIATTSGNTYYVATAGSSGNSGLSTLLPKQTWLQAMTVATGGDTILGNGGDVFREQITLSHANLTIGSYGTGQPIATGANVITGWATATAPRYSVAMATQTNIVFVNNIRAVKGASATTLNNGEWFWLASVLYYRSDTGNPDTLGLAIEAGQRAAALDTNSQNGWTARNVCLQRSNANESGLYAHFQPANYLVDGCTIRDHYGVGIHINGTTSTPGTIQNSTIANNGIYGIWHSHPQCLTQYVLGNTISGNAWRTDGSADFAGGWNGQVQSGEVAFNTISANGAGSTLSTGTAHGIYLNVDVTSCTLLIHHNDCSLHTKGNGIKADSSCTVYWNRSHENQWQGMEFGFNTTNSILIVAHHNACWLNGRGGLSMQHGTSGTGTLSIKGYHNTFYFDCVLGTAEEISVISDLALFDWRNNIVVGRAAANLMRTSATITGTITVDYNCWFGGNAAPFKWASTAQSFAAYKTSTGFDAHSIFADPTFTNAGAADFTLQAGSPCIDVGIAITGINDGFAGAAPDMGANEFAGAVVTPSGVSSTTAIGTVSIAVTAGGVVTTVGVQSATAIGAPTVNGSAKVTPSGVQAASTVGTVSVSASGSTTVTPSGVQGTTTLGTIAINCSCTVTPSGVSAASAVGVPTGIVARAPAGVQSATAVGSVTIALGTLVTPSGVSSTTAVGTARPAAMPIGVQVTTAIGTPIVTVRAVPPGVLATSSLGAAIVSGSAKATPAGVQAQSATGAASVVASGTANVQVTGVKASTAIGSVSVTTGATTDYARSQSMLALFRDVR